MADSKDMFNLGYYKAGGIFTGSETGIRYRAEKDEDVLKVSAWPEPYAYAHTQKDKITVKEFAFSEEGLEAAAKWLNEFSVSEKSL